MRILGIETSCDETSAAVVEHGTTVLSNAISSTKDLFSDLGGVLPEDAARAQTEYMIPVIETALRDANTTFKDIDAIAITHAPGLLGSLLVGTTTARALSSIHHIPLIGVHHTLGHLCSVCLDGTLQPRFPSLTLSASGGHTDLWLRTSHTKGQLLGRTRDDAAGEAFDKGAKLLGLPYPGGPSISASAEQGDNKAYAFPIALNGEDSFDYSFSGLKTALRYQIESLDDMSTDTSNLAASYQEAICLQLLDRIAHAVKKHTVSQIHIVGGVSANKRLRTLAVEMFPEIEVLTPSKISYCTDNAAMIASAGFFLTQESDDAHAPFVTSSTSPLEAVLS